MSWLSARPTIYWRSWVLLVLLITLHVWHLLISNLWWNPYWGHAYWSPWTSSSSVSSSSPSSISWSSIHINIDWRHPCSDWDGLCTWHNLWINSLTWLNHLINLARLNHLIWLIYWIWLCYNCCLGDHLFLRCKHRLILSFWCYCFSLWCYNCSLELGRASCRERVVMCVLVWVEGVS